MLPSPFLVPRDRRLGVTRTTTGRDIGVLRRAVAKRRLSLQLMLAYILGAFSILFSRTYILYCIGRGSPNALCLEKPVLSTESNIRTEKVKGAMLILVRYVEACLFVFAQIL
jgi:hypothetical protein